jgi:hypothetical protein
MPMMRSEKIRLSRFAFEALGTELGNSFQQHVPATMAGAVRCYLSDRGSGRPGWPYPSFLQERDPREGVEMELSLDEELWQCLEDEASRQGVSVRQMSEHAALYLAAEVNAGRITQWIFDESA